MMTNSVSKYTAKKVRWNLRNWLDETNRPHQGVDKGEETG